MSRFSVLGLLGLLVASSAASSTPEITTENNTLVIAASGSQEIVLRSPDGDIPLLAMMNHVAKMMECGNLNMYWNANGQECMVPGPGPQGKYSHLEAGSLYGVIAQMKYFSFPLPLAFRRARAHGRSWSAR